MNTKPVTLQQMLDAREKRAEAQRRLLSEYSLPLVSFSMNIAGEIKTGALISMAFSYGCKRIEAVLGEPVYKKSEQAETGPEAIYVYDLEPRIIKESCILIEEHADIGRLFDMDVITPDGVKLNRSNQRRCIVCGGPVAVCSRSRAHGLAAIKEEADRILKTFACERIADLAVEALISELNVTPKPGLVDLDNNGAHKDMYPELFYKSAECLGEYFSECVKWGMKGNLKLLPQLQQLGKDAEARMYSVTGGVNTHKGAVYIMGLICAAVGLCAVTDGDIFAAVSNMARQIKDVDEGSNGEKARKSVRNCGARAEAVNGLPSVRVGLDSLSVGDNPCTALMKILLVCNDSNLIYRGGTDALEYARVEARKVLSVPDSERNRLLSEMNSSFVKRNLSPGGCADMLAAAIFLHRLGDIFQRV